MCNVHAWRSMPTTHSFLSSLSRRLKFILANDFRNRASCRGCVYQVLLKMWTLRFRSSSLFYLMLRWSFSQSTILYVHSVMLNFFGKDFVWIWSVSLTQAMSISPGEHNVSSVSHLIRICESFMWTKWMNLHEENCVQVCNGTIWRSFSLSFESRSFEINSHLIRFCRMHCGAEKGFN